MQVGRPKKEISFDPEEVKKYVVRLFTLDQEVRGLRESKKDLKDEFKGKVDMKLVSNIIRLVKAQLKLTVSPETVEQLENIVKDNIGKVL
jgi:uncharacterized protein (UPF0335 family)